MAIGSGSKGEEPITAINVTPLVDVCLVLVIIFMAVAPMAVTVGISVLETRGKAAEGQASASENVNVKLALDGKISINGRSIDPLQLQPEIVKALAASKDKMVIITADEGNHVGQVVEILDTAQQSGALKLAIMKSEEAKPASGEKG